MRRLFSLRMGTAKICALLSVSDQPETGASTSDHNQNKLNGELKERIRDLEEKVRFSFLTDQLRFVALFFGFLQCVRKVLLCGKGICSGWSSKQRNPSGSRSLISENVLD